ncbi:MAG: hypothetical protein ACLFRB_06865 [Thiohalorhabdus sp.]|uniref:hypothetical protein n=1 Tax=Thiohalorhabdus sp. TaxID=3094134 RepID=UPI0039815CEA
MRSAASTSERRELDQRVVCECGHVVYDGEVIRARCVHPESGTAKCRCKRWVAVPVGLIRSAG